MAVGCIGIAMYVEGCSWPASDDDNVMMVMLMYDDLVCAPGMLLW